MLGGAELQLNVRYSTSPQLRMKEDRKETVNPCTAGQEIHKEIIL